MQYISEQLMYRCPVNYYIRQFSYKSMSLFSIYILKDNHTPDHFFFLIKGHENLTFYFFKRSFIHTPHLLFLFYVTVLCLVSALN